MSLLMILLLVLLVLAVGGGGWGHARFGIAGWSPAGIIVATVIVLLVTGNLR